MILVYEIASPTRMIYPFLDSQESIFNWNIIMISYLRLSHLLSSTDKLSDVTN